MSLKSNYDKLWWHQQEACKGIVKRKRGLIFDDTGVGKTAPPLVAADFLLSKGLIAWVLVLHEKNTTEKWEEEIRTWTTRPEKFVHTNHEQVKKRFAEFMTRPLGMVIVDEAHKGRTPTSKISKLLQNLVWNFDRFVGLTGTPQLNSIMNFWFPVWCCNRTVGTYNEFGVRWTKPKFLKLYNRWKRNYEVKALPGDPDPKKEAEFQLMLDKYTISKTAFSEAHPQVPEPVLEEIHLDFTPEEADLYREIWDQWEGDVGTGRVEYKHIFALQAACTQFTSHPSLIFPEFEGISAKEGVLLPWIEQTVSGGFKIVIISQFKKTISLLKSKLGHLGHVLSLEGTDNRSGKVGEILEAFKRPGYPILLLQGRLATGIDLDCASKMIFWDRTFLAVPWRQGIGRLRRPMQTEQVQVVVPIYRQSMDTTVKGVLERNEKLSSKLLRKPYLIRQAFAGKL